ncbi:hypothetical protein MYU51_007577 [Penicillium brevicompactum]|uniref:uncharacterized protein n=1 Tax=Penicillium brevicompactum TaxID=5074 RepID=UPI002541A1B4|nr:uncharacterized protein N7506_005942 [Penicillium brevicompactum]KAJ5332159.1 hypothetical protein N7506_005942 [Penicillium brevicompactum]
MAIRRSARIRRAQESPEVEESTPQPESVAPSQLASVAEGDESSELPRVQTPLTKTPARKPPSTHKTPSTSAKRSSTNAITPTSAMARPSRAEMHPSKAHQSTTKKVDSGLILGFNPITKDADGKVVNNGVADNTPTKSKPSPATSGFGTPGFEFKFQSQETDLSDQAKLLMDSVRGDVARIKAEMLEQKSKQDQEDEKAGHSHGDRKIAMPKGQAGRFSDIHMAEFKKMDSIAGHASSFRGTADRFVPLTKSLKRTKSKAQLDEPENHDSSPSRSAAKGSSLPAPTAPSTAKRVKHNQAEDTSARPQPSEVETQKVEAQKVETPRRPAGPRPRPFNRNSLMTPTRASLARSSLSVKAPKTSLIPSLKLSPAAKTIASPRTPQTDFNPRLKGKLPTLGNLRSILRRRQPLFSRDPAKIASGTHVAAPDFNPNSLFAGAGDVSDSAPTPSPKKHVEFTPSVKSRHELAVASPSPSKAPSSQRLSVAGDVSYPTLPTLTPEKNSKVTESTTPTSAPKSIRQIRKSDNEAVPGAFPELPVVTHGISHGIKNKKRHRDESDDNDTPTTKRTKNVLPVDTPSAERSAKRLKATPSPVKKRPTNTPVRPSASRVSTPVTASAKQKSRGVLSMSRLNMLSKPKNHSKSK